MPIVTGVIVDSTGRKDSRDWRVWSPTYAESATGEVVSTRVRTINVTAGVFRASIDPGVAVLENPDGKQWTVTVPETDIDLWDLISLSVGVPPETPQQWVTDAVNAWLEDNPPGAGTETDLTVTRTATTVTVESSTGTDALLQAADSSNAGVMTAAQQSKLAGIASGATANDTDANLKNRGNHTGTQTASTISDFNTAADARITAAGLQATSQKNQPNGYAGLDSSTLIPASLLPSYVDDVLEYANTGSFPGTGTAGKIYVALDSGKIYRWSGSAYVEISPSPGSTDAVPEGATNLYYTNTRADGRISAAIGVTVQGYNANTTQLGNTTTGTGSIVRATSPTLVTPVLGTPASGDLTNCTFPTLNQNTTGNAATATALASYRNFQTNLASTSAVAFNGTSNVTSGVTGTLPVANGGTGAVTLTGLVKGNGTSAMTAAAAGTDYVVPSGSITGNAATATKLATPRNINGVPFDGSGDVTIALPVWFEVHATYGTRATGYGDNTLGFLVPAGFTLTSVVFRGETADASGSTSVEIRKNGTQIATTVKTITAANQWAYGANIIVSGLSESIAAGDVLRPYISAIGTTPGRGFSAVLIGTTP